MNRKEVAHVAWPLALTEFPPLPVEVTMTVPSETTFTPTELLVLFCVESSFTVREPTELITI